MVYRRMAVAWLQMRWV